MQYEYSTHQIISTSLEKGMENARGPKDNVDAQVLRNSTRFLRQHRRWNLYTRPFRQQIVQVK